MALCATACQIEPIGETPSNNVEFSIVAKCPATKTANDGLATVWSEGDSFSAFYKHSGKYVNSRFNYQGENVFTGTISVPDKPCDWYAVYPYNSTASSPEDVYVGINNNVTQAGNNSTAHLAGEYFPLYGCAKNVTDPDSAEITMHQVAAVAKFSVTNNEAEDLVVSQIIFRAPALLGGGFTANLTESDIVWKPVAGTTSNTVNLTVIEGTAIPSGESADFYVGMMPFDVTGDFLIVVNGTANGNFVSCEKNISNRHIALTAGTITRIGFNFTLGEDGPDTPVDPVDPVGNGFYEKITSDPGQTGWAGKYLVVNTDGTKAFAAFADNASTYAVDVTVEDNKITSTPEIDAYALTITGGTDNHGNVSGQKAYDVHNSNGDIIFYSQGAIKIQEVAQNVGDDKETIYSYRHAFMYDGSVQMISSGTTSGQNKYYFNYKNGSFGYFGGSSSAQTAEVKAGRVDFYRYVEGNTGGGSDSGEGSEGGEGGGETTPDVPDVPEVPETDLGTFNLESNALNQYLNATSHYTDDNWKTVTVITSSPFSSMCGVGGEGYDFPTPVTVNWTGNNKQNVTVSIYSDSSRSADSLDQTASSTSTSVKFYNLIPNRKYYYTVALNDGTELDRGYFNTTGRRRQLKTTNTVSEDYATNVRDLGGMVTSDNKTLNYGLVYRGSNMRRIGSAEKAVIRDYMKVRLDVDLRRDEYGVTATSVFPESEVAYSHVAYDGTSMTDFLNKSKVNKTFSDIISYVSQGKAVYIHCKSGADRTGYVCMLIEAVCGVSLADCTKDYEITSFSKAGSRDRCGQKNAYLFQTALDHVLSAEGSTFQQKAINTLKTDGGITDAQIKALQDAMIQK